MADYYQFCGCARALDVVGGRWTLLIVRNLLLGPQRYTDLRDGLPGITTNMLADRLKAMQGEGLVRKARGLWTLTPLGRELEPVVLALGRFGQRYLDQGPRPADRMDVRWGMVSLKRRYRGDESGSARLSIACRVFRVQFSPGGVEVLEQDLPAELDLSGDLAGWLFRGAEPTGVVRSGEGWGAFCRSFGLADGMSGTI